VAATAVTYSKMKIRAVIRFAWLKIVNQYIKIQKEAREVNSEKVQSTSGTIYLQEWPVPILMLPMYRTINCFTPSSILNIV